MLDFTQRLIWLRREHPNFRRRHFFRGIHGDGVRDILWFNPDGREISDEEWTHDYARCLGLYLPGDGLGDWDERGHALQDDDFLLLVQRPSRGSAVRVTGSQDDALFEVLVDTACRRAARSMAAIILPKIPIRCKVARWWCCGIAVAASLSG